jgi:hypothetical protein
MFLKTPGGMILKNDSHDNSSRNHSIIVALTAVTSMMPMGTARGLAP